MTTSKLTAAGLALALSTAGAFADVESSDPIKLTTHDWTGQIITTTLMGEVLKKAGYNVEYVQADYIAQFAGLKTGDLHVAMEIWETTGKEAMDEAIGTGNVVSAGPTGMKAIEEWWYPAYMEERCPGLPDWEALNDCASEFATAETAPMGRYLGGPVTWGGFDEERIEALEMDFEVVHAGTDAALFAELEAAYQRQDPIVLWIYSPHWAPSKYDGKFVEFPPYSEECYADPSVGINPDAAYDCGKPRGEIFKVAWSGVADKWPGASEAINDFHITSDEMGAMVGAVDLDGKTVDAVVAEWMANNESTWQGWIN
ncbi:ABC transporter substrate-binding protein [Sulfitobacter mediterraneus]|jgi:glycine betaine/proline transport system substrate-binding protein|uniref:ABC transporter substrate-binding protein n=1 Tax=Sulfitobacter mediterraneus TaxID=83219 RepID=UPI0019349D5E|nr:ABC transporter substrate-binding protein [Sulfitobacter mediterraneus]MBM1634570.1 ABC transporter substrate-binding protein [Sulfitobacter mediterraneus]MBM1642388.1 ABC transporter substrate-binding protein [Sulfitobacter mediterraneus]MBM1646436.1 ABC transporter substrate-binding protein [Sulfitobacter mediterraneus]MBM1650482.1 ABC transporter substrate-binding protein [Sulfitobacter mediterraneus]MBM1654504.1 ABC transporter substrate-binding protein [Sulfitobacter mediterraneus]